MALEACPPSGSIANIMHRVYHFGAGLNDNGNVLSTDNCRDTTRTAQYQYDSLNRITQGNSTGPEWGDTYGVDAWGNLTTMSQIPGKAAQLLQSTGASWKNQLGGLGHVHDAAGNLTNDGIHTYTYDIENRIKCLATTCTSGIWTYFYDGDGNRVKKCNSCSTAAGGTMYWMGTTGDANTETDLAGSLKFEYVFFNGKRVARRDGTSNPPYFYFADHLGSTSFFTNSTGTSWNESDYFPYGGEIVVFTPFTQPYKFAGKERDTESGLDYFGARFYSGTLGRLMSVDPVSLGSPLPMTKNPQRWNAYTYALNNPLRFIDMDGRFSAPIHTGLTDEATLNKGYSQATATLMVRANLYVDRISNQLNNHEHGMRNTLESRAHAGREVQKVIDSARQDAVSAALKGNYVGAAQSLGTGLHTVQDLVAHQLETLVGHGRESPNDRNLQKLQEAETDSERFLKSFDDAVLTALGPEKGEQVLDRVRHAGDSQADSGVGADPFSRGEGDRAEPHKRDPNL